MANSGRPDQTTQKEVVKFPFLTLTALRMPTACRSAPFGIEVTRVRLQPSRQLELNIRVIHRIAKLEFELLSVVHDHYGHELPAVTPMYIPIQGGGGSTHLSETCEPPTEPDSHYDGPSQSVRKLTSRF